VGASASAGTVINMTLSPAVLQYSVANLMPGICYLCSLRASTRFGFGPSTTRLVWTRPDGNDVNCFFFVLFSKEYAFFYMVGRQEERLVCKHKGGIQFTESGIGFIVNRFSEVRLILINVKPDSDSVKPA